MEINNYKIDPLDKEYLDECVNSFRLDLLHEAYMLSKKSDEEGISQKSIDEALANIVRNNNVSSKRVYFKGKRLVYLGVLTGLLYTVCGSVIFFVQNTNFRPDKDLGQFVMIMGLAVSACFAIFGIFVNKSRHLFATENSNKLNKQYMIVHKWSEIENLVNSMSPMRVNTIQSILPILLDICKEDISSDDISSVLYLRNKILHDNASIPDFEIDLALRTENRIISKLKEKILVGTGNLK